MNHNGQKPLLQQQSKASDNMPPNEASVQQLLIQQQQQQQPLEQHMANLHLSHHHRPGRSKRVYAPILSTHPQPPSQPHQPQQYQPPQPQRFQSLQQPQQPYSQQQPISSRPKPRIDPDTLPSPIALQTKDETHYATHTYGTCSTDTLPLASTDFIAIDQGNSNPRFIRATMAPSAAAAASQSNSSINNDIPFGLVVQPLARLNTHDAPVPVIERDPTRCRRCKGYLNPWCTVMAQWTCNLCGVDNELSGVENVEMQLGTVDYDVSDEYAWNRNQEKKEETTAVMRWLWVVDVSRSGLDALEKFCHVVKGMMSSLEGVKVGLMTYDTTLHFYNLKTGTIMVVSDLNDIFIPMDDLFVEPIESRPVIEGLLDRLPKLYEHTLISQAAFGPAIQASLLAMKSIGGKVSIFQSTLPSAGPSQTILTSRENPALYGTEQEKGLLAPHGKFYMGLAEELAKSSISVDVWASGNNLDLATTSVLSRLTGGDVRYVEESFEHDWRHVIERDQGYRATLRVRCSNGLSVLDYDGRFYQTNSTDMELANVHADTSLGVLLKNDQGNDGYVQVALLYTIQSGKRRIRVHNLKLTTTTTANTAPTAIYKTAELDTIMNLVIKRLETRKKSLNDLSNELDDWCVKVLVGYRQKCAPHASPAQLILPDSLRNLPLFVSSLKKSILLRKDPSISLDNRVYHLHKIKGLGVSETIRWLYPRCIAMDTMSLVRASYDRLDPRGIYCIQSHDAFYVWIGHQNTMTTTATPIEALLNDENVRVRYNKIKQEAVYLPKLQVIQQGVDGEVSSCLIEDDVSGQMSYVDYVCMIHKQIQLELEREKQDTIISAASYWTHRY
ncbi:MAG: hypothetical protein EXX96DRAFT_568719 [Benjaminiella poitrasii]|nr:MAG: hypothetical protein EXX96DRAFT_568719 [Benjaminiella poitrasii]